VSAAGRAGGADGADGGEPPDADGVSSGVRAELAAHLRELERAVARGEGEAAGGEATSPELQAMLERLREVVAALDGLLAGGAGGTGGADAAPPGREGGDAPSA
jgi:hypothetical protein